MITSKRKRDWQSRLAALIAERQDMPFSWASHDCCLFAADAVMAVTGEDPAAHLRESYHDAASATALVATLGGLSGIATEALGEPLPPLMARPGDIGLVEHGGRQLLAVCTGGQWHCTSTERLAVLPIRAALAAWHVG